MPLKLITRESSLLRIGVVMFLMTWVVWVIVGLAIFGGCVFFAEIPTSLIWWVPVTAVPLGFFTTRAGIRAEMRVRRERKAQAERIPGEHPLLGPFYGLPYYQYWHAPSVPTPCGKIHFAGSGLAPSDAQAAQCMQIIERLPRLVNEAVARLLPPLESCVETETCEFTPTRVTLSEHGDFELHFKAPLISRQIDEYPSAIFSVEGVLREVEWSP
jgi:hypothetical protein